MNGLRENQKLESAQNVSLPIGIEKKCSKCQEIKKIEYFLKKGCCCKKCDKTYKAEYFKKNKEHLYLKHRNWVKAHPELNREYKKKWAEKNFLFIKKGQKNYYTKNKDKIIARTKVWNKNNPDYHKKWRKKQREKNPMFKMNHNFRKSLWYSLKGRKHEKRWDLILGYTLGELKKKLEKNFLPGMTWDNYGKWHIDHILPIAVFNFTSINHIDFKRCWALKNLRPLWAKENQRKGAKINKSFQPALPL